MSKWGFTLFAQHWRQIPGKLTNLGTFASFEVGNLKQEVHQAAHGTCTTGMWKVGPAAPWMLWGLTLPGWRDIFRPVSPARRDAVRVVTSISCLSSCPQPLAQLPTGIFTAWARPCSIPSNPAGQELPSAPLAPPLLCSPAICALWLHSLVTPAAVPLGCSASCQLGSSGCPRFLVPQRQYFYFDC